MPKLFVLIRKTSTGKLVGAIPTKAGSTKAKVLKAIKGRVKRGFSASVITEAELKKLIVRMRPKRKTTTKRRKTKASRRRKPSTKKPVKRRKVKRRRTRRRKK